MTFKAFLHRNSLWLLCVAVSVLIFFLIHLYVPVPPEEVAINMMFNITQSLAAIVTLAISIPLVAAQMSARYSIGALDIVFTRKTVAYFIWLIFSTLYPLLIAGSLTLHASGAAISFMASCIILLIPYFYETKERLKPENLLKDLSDRAKRELQNMLSETILREVEKEINTFPFFPH